MQRPIRCFTIFAIATTCVIHAWGQSVWGVQAGSPPSAPADATTPQFPVLKIRANKNQPAEEHPRRADFRKIFAAAEKLALDERARLDGKGPQGRSESVIFVDKVAIAAARYGVLDVASRLVAVEPDEILRSMMRMHISIGHEREGEFAKAMSVATSVVDKLPGLLEGRGFNPWRDEFLAAKLQFVADRCRAGDADSALVVLRASPAEEQPEVLWAMGDAYATTGDRENALACYRLCLYPPTDYSRRRSNRPALNSEEDFGENKRFWLDDSSIIESVWTYHRPAISYISEIHPKFSAQVHVWIAGDLMDDKEAAVELAKALQATEKSLSMEDEKLRMPLGYAYMELNSISRSAVAARDLKLARAAIARIDAMVPQMPRAYRNQAFNLLAELQAMAGDEEGLKLTLAEWSQSNPGQDRARFEAEVRSAAKRKLGDMGIGEDGKKRAPVPIPTQPAVQRPSVDSKAVDEGIAKILASSDSAGQKMLKLVALADSIGGR